MAVESGAAALDLIGRLTARQQRGGAGALGRAHARHERRRPADEGPRDHARHQARAPHGLRRHRRRDWRRQPRAAGSLPHQAVEPVRAVLAAGRPAGGVAGGLSARRQPHGAVRRPLVARVLRAARVPVAQSRAVPLSRHRARGGPRRPAQGGRSATRCRRCRSSSRRTASAWSGRPPATSPRTSTCRRAPNSSAITSWWSAPARPA